MEKIEDFARILYTKQLILFHWLTSSSLYLFISPSLYLSYLRTIYMESMGKTLLNLFKSYCSQLLKLELLMAGKNDLIAVEEATLKSVFTQKVRTI